MLCYFAAVSIHFICFSLIAKFLFLSARRDIVAHFFLSLFFVLCSNIVIISIFFALHSMLDKKINAISENARIVFVVAAADKIRSAYLPLH